MSDDVEIQVHTVPVDPELNKLAKKAQEKAAAERAKLPPESQAIAQALDEEIEREVLEGPQDEEARLDRVNNRVADLLDGSKHPTVVTRNCHVSVAQEQETGEHAVVVTARAYEADADWWTKAADSRSWVVEPLELEGIQMIRAIRTCGPLFKAQRQAAKTKRQIARSLDRFYEAERAKDLG